MSVPIPRGTQLAEEQNYLQAPNQGVDSEQDYLPSFLDIFPQLQHSVHQARARRLRKLQRNLIGDSALRQTSSHGHPYINRANKRAEGFPVSRNGHCPILVYVHVIDDWVDGCLVRGCKICTGIFMSVALNEYVSTERTVLRRRIRQITENFCPRLRAVELEVPVATISTRELLKYFTLIAVGTPHHAALKFYISENRFPPQREDLDNLFQDFEQENEQKAELVEDLVNVFDTEYEAQDGQLSEFLVQFWKPRMYRAVDESLEATYKRIRIDVSSY